ncbi:MAG: hypothetical protein R2827_02215 [Bdellovibrionales bacterium]
MKAPIIMDATQEQLGWLSIFHVPCWMKELYSLKTPDTATRLFIDEEAMVHAAYAQRFA